MSEVKVNKLSPRNGTTVTIGDSGDTINIVGTLQNNGAAIPCLLYTSPSPRDRTRSRMPSSA